VVLVTLIGSAKLTKKLGLVSCHYLVCLWTSTTYYLSPGGLISTGKYAYRGTNSRSTICVAYERKGNGHKLINTNDGEEKSG